MPVYTHKEWIQELKLFCMYVTVAVSPSFWQKRFEKVAELTWVRNILQIARLRQAVLFSQGGSGVLWHNKHVVHHIRGNVLFCAFHHSVTAYNQVGVVENT